jgi:hypothetical protein
MRVHVVCVLLLMGLSLPGPASSYAAANEPAALVLQLSGAVQVQRSGAPAPEPARAGMQLMAADELLVPEAGRVVLLHRGGRTETLLRSTRIAAPTVQQAAGLFQQTLRTMAEVATSDARVQPNRQGMIRPIAGGAVAIAPRNDLVVSSLRPTFSWFRVPETRGYTLQVREAEGGLRRFEVGSDTSWSLPAADAPLIRGARYEWAVAAADAGRVSDVQYFRVASEAETHLLEERLAQIRAVGLDPQGDGLLLAAFAYRDAGFFYEAADLLDRFTGCGTPTDAAFHMLRGEVLDAIGRVDAAQYEFEVAEHLRGSSLTAGLR